jgi:hypothetical protein
MDCRAGSAMNTSASQLLQWKLRAARTNPVAALALMLLAFGVAAWLWYWPQSQAQKMAQARKPAPTAAPAQLVSAPDASQNLAAFYAALGEQREAEQQIKTLFALAAKNGLNLAAGQYRAAYEQNGRFHTYQVSLPVKGSYRAVWQFCLQTLAAIPFAALDDLSVRREAVGDAAIEAHVRFTLYLREGAGKP